MKAILVTACPAGIATSFLAAKRIEQQAKLAGWELTLDVGSSVLPCWKPREAVPASIAMRRHLWLPNRPAVPSASWR
jgi:hypothetical protein